MVLTREDEARNLDWDKIKDTLENRHEHDLNNLEVNSRFIEDLARYTGGSAELAYGLHQEFDIDSDQVIVDHRTFNAGQQGHMTSILIQKDDGSVVKDLYKPQGTYDPEDPDEPENNFLYLRHNENTPEGGEQALTNAWNSELGTTAGLQLSNWLKASEDNDRWDRGTWEALDEIDDQLIVGYNYEDKGKVVYTMDGAMATEQTLNPNNINDNPKTVGVKARNLVVEATEFYDANVKETEGAYMEVDYDGENFRFDVVDEERHDELEVNYGE